MAADAPTTAPEATPPSLWARHRTACLTAALAVYALVLAVAVADDVLHLGLFPTRLERMARDLIADLDHPDEAQRRRAADKLVRDVDPFVAVPQLFRALDDPSGTRRAAAVECLRRITRAAHGYQPDAPRPERRDAIKRWRAWWRDSKYRY